jgi:hypothetical protein
MNQRGVLVAAMATILAFASVGTNANAGKGTSCVSNSAGDVMATGGDGSTCDANADTGGTAKASTVKKFESFATAHNNATATSSASKDSDATTLADHSSTATATAKSHSGANATADNSSSAVVNASDGSSSEADADSGGSAKATGSKANALAIASGCTATATAKDTNNGATATCTAGSAQATSSDHANGATAQNMADCDVVAKATGKGSMSEAECNTSGGFVTVTTTKGGQATGDGINPPTCTPGKGTAKVRSSAGNCG